ncbi:MAG: CapA family protein [Senegalia sp. (in: firmicutes)]|uniref:CapA family protein n=1 Tax=Senegalia sp. (in: firmicutes) TaxID=1924098 RepID=UPI003F96BE98
MKKLTVIIMLLLSISFGLLACSDIDNSGNDIKKDDIKKDDIVVEEKDEYSKLSLYATGDIMFHGSQLKSAYNNSTGEYDFKEVFEPVKRHLENADIAIGNFETTTAGDSLPISSYPSFNSPDSTVSALKYAGFDILSTANNHSLDTGKIGVVNTINNIEKNDMDYIGTSKEDYKPFILKEENEIVLSFLSYTYGLNGNDSRLSKEELEYMINLIDEEKIEEDIKRAKNVSDKVVVFIHWGDEYSRSPSEFQMTLADKMFSFGADVILGSHPHVIQRSEMIKKDGEDKFIIYSMGNFISNQRRETLPNVRNNIYTEDGIMININFKKNLKTEEVIIEDVNYLPTWVYKYAENSRNKYEILPVADFVNDEKLSVDIKKRLENSFNQTMELMEKVEIVE